MRQFLSKLISQRSKTPRLLWLLNHKTLLPAEVNILTQLGWGVFTPKIVPTGPEFVNTVTTFAYDSGLELPSVSLQTLNMHNFYEDPWTKAVQEVIAKNFDVVISSVYEVPLREALTKFDGLVVARAFGREAPLTYTEMMQFYRLESTIQGRRDKFVFGQGFDAISQVEAPYLAKRSKTVGVAVPDSVWREAETWHGIGEKAALLLCPKIKGNPYYGQVYQDLKRVFSGLPYRIFGRQIEDAQDPAVLPYLTDVELLEHYRGAPLLAYPSVEPRHVHYSPIEAMVVGTPVLYREGGLIDVLAGEPLPGRCATESEMREKTERLLNDDTVLQDTIRRSQKKITQYFAPASTRDQWAGILPALPSA